MDTLSKILDLLHFNGTFYYATNFHSPWGIVVPKYKNVARFHYVTQGSCWVKIEGIEEPQLLSSGDLIIISHGTSHVISDKVDRKPVSLEQAFAREGYTGQGVFHIGKGVSLHDTQLICGHFEFKEFFKHPLIDHLPKFIITNENNGKEFSWLKEILHFMSHTATAQQNGSSAIIKRLSEVIFIQTIRLWYEKSNGSTGFIAALNDKQIAKGLKAFHDNYAENWTVEMLAQQSNMSR